MTRPRSRLSLESLEDRSTPAWVGSLPADVALLPTADPGRFRVLDLFDGSDIGDVRPFTDSFAGEVRAAAGDVTGDGTPDLIVAAGPGGGARVRVFDGATGAVVRDFFALDPDFRGGVYVAAGDVDRDGFADIVVGAGEGGGPRVRVFDGRTGGVRADFFAFEASFRGGVRVAAGDVDGDGAGAAEVVVGAGPGGGPRVVVFRVPAAEPGAMPDGKPAEVASFLAYAPTFRGGVYVATAWAGRYAASADGSEYVGPAAKVVTGPGAGAPPVAKVFDGTGREYFANLKGDPSAHDGLRLVGGTYGYLAEVGGVMGLSNFGGPGRGTPIPATGGRVTGVVDAVDVAAGTLTIRTYRSDVRVIPVPSGTPVGGSGGRATLAAVRVGAGATALLGNDGAAVEISVLPPSPAVAVPVA